MIGTEEAVKGEVTDRLQAWNMRFEPLSASRFVEEAYVVDMANMCIYDVARIAGVNVDVAVPQSWLDKPENAELFYSVGVCWYYPNEDVFGRPLTYSELWKMAWIEIKAEYERRK